MLSWIPLDDSINLIWLMHVVEGLFQIVGWCEIRYRSCLIHGLTLAFLWRREAEAQMRGVFYKSRRTPQKFLVEIYMIEFPGLFAGRQSWSLIIWWLVVYIRVWVTVVGLIFGWKTCSAARLFWSVTRAEGWARDAELVIIEKSLSRHNAGPRTRFALQIIAVIVNLVSHGLWADSEAV